MIIFSKKGSALLQVLLVTAVLAGIATMLLRASVARSSTARKVKRDISTQVLVESCMAQVNSLWAAKNADTFARDLDMCIMYCTDDCSTEEHRQTTYTCSLSENGQSHNVVASIENGTSGNCQITYTVEDAAGL